VFVCKGNICRSAYAEVVARSLGLDAVSCGLRTIVAVPANEDAVRAARVRGVDLEDHKTTPIMYMVLRKTDLLVAMEPWQVEFMERHLVRGYCYTLLGLWFKPVNPHIQDPYGASSDYFDHCFKYIEDAVHVISEKIKRPADKY
jgi:protein-tyrosine phosphatase